MQLSKQSTAGGADEIPDGKTLAEKIEENAAEQAQQHTRRGVRRVINGTGIILNSEFGRACLSKTAAQALMETVTDYSTIEYDVQKGTQGSRTGYIEGLLYAITGCEAALIVNNNAAAVLLILATVAHGGEIIVSRGELVEVSGGFRIQDLALQAGCRLSEVGATNNARLSDYADAIDANTRALLKVFSNNYRIVGYAQSVAIKELAELGSALQIPSIVDLGGGALADLNRYGIVAEPSAADCLKNGTDIVSFSGDKLMGGPQCGIILGRERHLSAMRANPLYRALRADKMTITALEATLRVYADPIAAEREIPVLAMLALSEDRLQSRAVALCEDIKKRGGSAEVFYSRSTAGSEAVPGLELDSRAISPVGALSAQEMERALRLMPVPIIGYIEKGRLLLDIRTIFEDDFEYVSDAVAKVSKLGAPL